jgi:Cytochrome b5-like Heme/Steroid binding domain
VMRDERQTDARSQTEELLLFPQPREFSSPNLAKNQGVITQAVAPTAEHFSGRTPASTAQRRRTTQGGRLARKLSDVGNRLFSLFCCSPRRTRGVFVCGWLSFDLHAGVCARLVCTTISARCSISVEWYSVQSHLGFLFAFRVPLFSKMTTTHKEYTLEEVAKHDKHDDCWIVVDGKVLDVTGFLEDHPGGEEIIQDVAGWCCFRCA